MFPEVLRKTRSAIDYSELKNKPYIDFEINLDYLDTNKRQNTIMDLIQQNLLPDNDKFYAQYDKKKTHIKLIKIQIRQKKTKQYQKFKLLMLSQKQAYLSVIEER